MVRRIWCAVWGHAVDNRVFRRNGRACTRCGCTYLRDDDEVIRVGHTLSCFLRHHTYERVAVRDGHAEYACMRCGHPLLFRVEEDPYDGRDRFEKRVRYLCGLFGHHVHAVAVRHGGTEYACHCGHTFVQRPSSQRVIHHPLVCFLSGHAIAFIGARPGFSEYACRRCGHSFLLSDAASVGRGHAACAG
jgi:DNA-directed RNA polymerase subunit RPC12/RpoP